MTKLAAERLFSKTNLTPQDVDVIELHDCFSSNELITYEALGLCQPGKGAELVKKILVYGYVSINVILYSYFRFDETKVHSF